MKIKELTGRDDTNFQALDFSTIGGAAASGEPKPKKEKPVKDGKPKQEQGKKLTAEEKKARKDKELAQKEGHELSVNFKKE